MLKVAFDIGGVISKYPGLFRKWVQMHVVTPYILTDMSPLSRVKKTLEDNYINFPEGNILLADYEKYGEMCKAVVCEEQGIDILIDDHVGYLAIPGSPLIRLLVMPDPALPYFAKDWKDDRNTGTEGRFPAGGKRPPELRQGVKREATEAATEAGSYSNRRIALLTQRRNLNEQ